MIKISFLPIILCVLFVSCKPKNSLKINTTDSSSSSKKGINMPDLNTIAPNKNTVSGGGSWTKEYRSKFLQGCITKASEKVSASDAFSYCDCMTNKVEAKYPTETEVDSKLTASDIETMKSGCPTTSNQSQNNNQSNNNNSSTSWSASDQKEFMDNCTPGASTSLGQTKASEYCSCMLYKIMQEYPKSADASNMPKSHMSELAKQCFSK